MSQRFLSSVIASIALLLVWHASAQASDSQVSLTAIDKATGQPIACRIHLKDSAGKPQRAGNLPFWNDHFVCPGTVQLRLPPGKYTYEVERGPEYTFRAGIFQVQENAPSNVTIDLERIADLATEGWWSGELHVHRPVEDIELLMRAEDLHVAPVITWWNNRNQWAGQKRLPDNPLTQFDKSRFYHVLAGEDEREGGALLYFNLRRPLAITGSTREYPSPTKFLGEARGHASVHVDIEKPFWWDVPVWLAGGQVDTIGLANNHMNRDRMSETEAWGKPRDPRRLPPPRGNGFWTQEIYYHLLNCGLRLPPSAGSASGVLPNPVGYNRVYVHLDGDLGYEQWWAGLRAGRSFVTNGPLLRVRANGQLPGHIFSARQDEPLTLEIRADLTTREPIQSLEIIRDGRIERAVPFEEYKRTGSLGAVRFARSGWFLIRVIANNPKTFRFASTAPYYVEIGDKKQRIHKESVQFFLDWLDERQKRIKLDDAEQRREVLAPHLEARKFWEERLTRAE